MRKLICSPLECLGIGWLEYETIEDRRVNQGAREISA